MRKGRKRGLSIGIAVSLILTLASGAGAGTVYDLDWGETPTTSALEFKDGKAYLYPGDTLEGIMTLYMGKKNLEEGKSASLGDNGRGQSEFTNTTGSVYSIEDVSDQFDSPAPSYLLRGVGYAIEVVNGTASSEESGQGKSFSADKVHVTYDDGTTETVKPQATWYGKGTVLTIQPDMDKVPAGKHFAKWDLDMVHPMAYCDFYTMDPSFARDATLCNVQAVPDGITVMTGVDTELGGDPWKIFDKMDAAFSAGAQGISLYTIEGLNSPELRAKFKVYADSLRAVRAAGRLPKAPAVAPSTVPFDNRALMDVVNRNLQRMVAGEAIHVKSVNGMVPDDPSVTYPDLDLGEWELSYDSDRLQIYNVIDKASGKSFAIYFVLYGDLISGWDIRPVE